MNDEVFELLGQRADLQARLRFIPYSGSPEIKEKGGNKYLYMRKKIEGRMTSNYVGKYSEELHELLRSNTAQEKSLNKQLRATQKKLTQAGYRGDEINFGIFRALNYAQTNLKKCIHTQAVLEGIEIPYKSTEDIIDNNIINAVKVNDVKKILNIKCAWDFILNKSFIMCETDYYMLCRIAEQINSGIIFNGGRLRGVPVRVQGTSYIAPLPDEQEVKEKILSIVHSDSDELERAADLVVYCLKSRLFIDGNMKIALIFANHFLISRGLGYLMINTDDTDKFKDMLKDFYDGKDEQKIRDFLINHAYHLVE